MKHTTRWRLWSSRLLAALLTLPLCAFAAATPGDGVDLRLSELIGKPVRNAQGEGLGEIQDLVLDVHNSHVHYALLRFPGFLGFGDKRFAYPLGAFALAEDGSLRLEVPRRRLKDAAGLSGFARESATDTSDLAVPEGSGMVSLPNQKLRRASELKGQAVRDPNGEPVGRLLDAVVDIGTGQVHYVALERIGAPARERLVALPLTGFSFTEDRKEAIVHLPRAQLALARGFAPDAWPRADLAMAAQGDAYVLATLAGAASPLAQETPADTRDAQPAEREQLFEQLDGNGDGQLTREEAAANAWVAQAWEELDQDGDGRLVREDLMALDGQQG